jgi:hypothetical protein
MKSLMLAKDTVEENQGPFGAVERVPPLKTFHMKVLSVGVILAIPDPGTYEGEVTAPAMVGVLFAFVWEMGEIPLTVKLKVPGDPTTAGAPGTKLIKLTDPPVVPLAVKRTLFKTALRGMPLAVLKALSKPRKFKLVLVAPLMVGLVRIGVVVVAALLAAGATKLSKAAAEARAMR